ncbi:MFS general substrate transporter [Cytidiella melzeri]|nr:MFS general substrate transporter [Cytidiella melzeri]
MSSLSTPTEPSLDIKSADITIREVLVDGPAKTRKGVFFWLSFLAICVSLFMSAVEMTGTSTALPTIAHDLEGDDFVWVGSAYPLAATALLPASGGMAEIFGRRSAMLVALGLFALGSALCGSAQNMSWLIAARTLQGAGGGAIQAVTGIIVSDLVPLQERGLYSALTGLTWAVAAAIGPLVGGATAQTGQWRWLFYMNLPISGLAAGMVVSFLRLKAPPATIAEKLSRMDWIGNIIFVGSSTSTILALTWGGFTSPWKSVSTLVPLIVGLCGLAFFVFYEARFAPCPILPFTLISNRTSLSGFVQTFITPIIVIAITYYQIAWYQACKGVTPIGAGVSALALTLSLGPAVILSGTSVTLTKSYRVQLWVGWCLLIISMGLFSTVRADTPISRPIGYSAIVGAGGGMLFAATYFPVLAPLPVSENAHALAFFAFCRSFASVWGVTIGGAVLQNQLAKRLPAEFTSQFPDGVGLAYAAIPQLKTLEEPLKTEVLIAFAESVRVIWQVMIGITVFGLLASLPMKALPLHTQVDARWGMVEGIRQRPADTERDSSELQSAEEILPKVD